jgi:hypothetical protein
MKYVLFFVYVRSMHAIYVQYVFNFMSEVCMPYMHESHPEMLLVKLSHAQFQKKGVGL